MNANLPRDERALSLAAYLGYGVGSLGTAIFSTVPGLLLLYFMTDTLGIAPGLAGLAVSIPKFWDVVSDPIVGTMSDRTRSRWGRRRPWLLAGALTLPITLFFLFAVPDLATPTARFWWVLVMFSLAATAFTAFQVPYVSMPPEMTPHTHEYTVLVSWRMAFMTLGTLVGGGLGPMLVKLGGGGKPGYAWMGAVLGAIAGISMMGTFLGTKNAPKLGPTEHELGFWSHLRAAVKNRAFFIMILSLVAQLTALGVLLSSVPYYARYILGGSNTQVTLMFLSLVIPALFAMPVWTLVGRRLTKATCYRLSVGMFGLLGLSLYMPGPAWSAYARIALMGLFYAGTQVFPFSMLPDIVRAEQAATGVRREGIFSGIFTAAEKMGLAAGALIVGLALGAFGFVERVAGVSVEQPSSALLGIRLTMSVVPTLLFLACYGILLAYPRDASGGK